MNMTTAAVTGQRKYSGQDVFDAYCKAYEDYNVLKVHIGMAEGVDLTAGLAALEMQVPIIAAVPFEDHMAPAGWEDIYTKIIDNAYDVVHVNRNYLGPDTFHSRNRYMVNNSDVVLAWHDGTPKGGTYQTMVYAKRLQRLVDVIGP